MQRCSAQGVHDRFGSKPEKSRYEHMFSALPPIADMAYGCALMSPRPKQLLEPTGSCRRVLHFSTGSSRFRRENPNHWLALTRFGRGLSVNGCCWGFETRPRKYRRREAIILRFAASFVNSERGLRSMLAEKFFLVLEMLKSFA